MYNDLYFEFANNKARFNSGHSTEDFEMHKLFSYVYGTDNPYDPVNKCNWVIINNCDQDIHDQNVLNNCKNLVALEHATSRVIDENSLLHNGQKLVADTANFVTGKLSYLWQNTNIKEPLMKNLLSDQGAEKNEVKDKYGVQKYDTNKGTSSNEVGLVNKVTNVVKNNKDLSMFIGTSILFSTVGFLPVVPWLGNTVFSRALLQLPVFGNTANAISK